MLEEKSITGVILVAGDSTRYGQNRNKNFDSIKEKTVMSYSLKEFEKNSYIDDLIIGVKKEEIPIVEKIIQEEKTTKPIQIVLGGASRQETVYNCIQKTKADIVIIHDGARPAIKQTYINECIKSMEEFKGVTIGVPSKDTIKITDENNIVVQSTNRNNTWIIQTPQCFHREMLLQAHEKYKNETVTDDCMLLEKNHEKVKILEGDYTNIKITTYEDIILMKKMMDKE